MPTYILGIQASRSSTNTPEGTSRTLVEARALGCPVVATRAGSIPTSTQHEHDGLLVDPNDSRGLAAAIERPSELTILAHQFQRHSRTAAL